MDDSRLQLGEDNTVTLPAGMSIDLGGIAKGYIADQVAGLVRGRTSASALNFGGNTYMTGTKPNGSPWRLGIQDPDSSTGTPLLVITMGDGTVVTSGVYERYFIKDGVRYHHILDPKTGCPARTDVVSATIVGHDSIMADAYATACVVLGSEKAIELMEILGQDALLMLQDGTILYTAGFEDKYSPVPYQ